MQRTRRGVLGAAIAAGVAGCLGVEGVEYPDTQPAVSDTDDEHEMPDTDEEPPTVTHNQKLADATRDVVDDTLWFATEYSRAVREYVSAISHVVETIDEVVDDVLTTETVTEEQADTVETAGFAAADRAHNALEPHFSPRSGIERRTTRHVSVLRTFAGRDDIDRFLEELRLMQSRFRSIGHHVYTAEAFSRDPIHNRLLGRLLHPLPSASSDRQEILNTTLIELAVGDDFATFAHKPFSESTDNEDHIPRIYGDPVDANRRADADRRTEIRARLGPVVQPESRTAELFFIFSTRPEPQNNPFTGWTFELGGPVVYVQRYDNPETAADRLESVFAGGQTEDTEPINPNVDRIDGLDEATQWHRFFHHEARGERYAFDDHAGVQYGYVTRAGEFLLAAGFSGDAWEERASWQGTLENGWAVI